MTRYGYTNNSKSDEWTKYYSEKNRLKKLANEYQNKCNLNKKDIELCDDLKEEAKAIIDDLTYVSESLSSVDTAISYGGLIINGKSALAGKVSDKISNAESVSAELENFITAVEQEKTTLQQEYDLNYRIYGQYDFQYRNLRPPKP